MIHVLASGVLTDAPQQRTSAKGNTYCRGSMKVSGSDSFVGFVSFIAFDDSVTGELLALQKGDGLAIAGPAKLTEWTGKNGEQKHGLSVIVDRLLPNKPTPKPKAARPKPAPTPALAEAEPFSDEIPF